MSIKSHYYNIPFVLPGECIELGMAEFGVELPGGLPEELWFGVP